MKNYNLLAVSLPTNNEQKIIDYINNLKTDNRKTAQILTFTNSLVLANNDIEKYQLYAMMLKDYILGRYNGKVNQNIELDEIIKSIDIYNEKLAKENICLLLQYLEVDDITRFKLASNFVNTITEKNNRYKGIRERDNDTCAMLCNKLNKVIETRVRNNNCNMTYRKVSSK